MTADTFSVKVQVVDVWGIGLKEIDTSKKAVQDESTGYIIYATTDGHKIAFDDAISSWVQLA